jgi:hypothetical protein
MNAILNRAMAIPTVRSFGYSLYLTATVLFSATTVYAQGMQSSCRWGGLMPIRPNRVGSATRAAGSPTADGGGLMPIKLNRVGAATHAAGNPTADGGGLTQIKPNGGLGLQLDSLAPPPTQTVSQFAPDRGPAVR